MKGLRIELGGKTLDIVSANFGFAAPVPRANFQVIEPVDHGDPARYVSSLFQFRPALSVLLARTALAALAIVANRG